MKRPAHTQVKKTLLKKPSVLKAYNDLEEEHQVIHEMLLARQRAGLTQASLAKKMKTTTSAVSRLESLQNKDQHSPSLQTLKRYAHAVDCVLKIKLMPKTSIG